VAARHALFGDARSSLALALRGSAAATAAWPGRLGISARRLAAGWRDVDDGASTIA